MEQTPRRTFIRKMLGGVMTASLVRGLCSAQALSAGVRPVAAEWLG